MTDLNVFSDLMKSEESKVPNKGAPEKIGSSDPGSRREADDQSSVSLPRSKNSGSHSVAGSSSSRKSKSKFDGFEGLADILKSGFDSMRASLEGLGESVANKIVSELQPLDVPGEHDLSESDVEEGDAREQDVSVSDFFQNLSENLTEDEAVGPDIDAGLAGLVHQMLSVKISSNGTKERCEKFPKPKNCKFLEQLKVNPEVWTVLGKHLRRQDLILQESQKLLLKSSIPVIKAIEVIHKSKVDKIPVDHLELIKTLCDSVAFVGASNFGLVKARQDFIKPALPSKWKGLCFAPEKLPEKFLFGDNLSDRMKEISETNKLTNSFSSQPGTSLSGNKGRLSFGKTRQFRFRGFHSAPYFRGNWRALNWNCPAPEKRGRVRRGSSI